MMWQLHDPMECFQLIYDVTNKYYYLVIFLLVETNIIIEQYEPHANAANSTTSRDGSAHTLCTNSIQHGYKNQWYNPTMVRLNRVQIYAMFLQNLSIKLLSFPCISLCNQVILNNMINILGFPYYIISFFNTKHISSVVCTFWTC